MGMEAPCPGSSLALLLARCGTVNKSLDLFALQFHRLRSGGQMGSYLRVVGKRCVLSTPTGNLVGPRAVCCAELAVWDTPGSVLPYTTHCQS